jgi:mannose/fructose/N-acetylgalactosamine-specific phosphotransferase system component IID
LLIVIITIFIRALIRNDSGIKTRSLIASLAWFAIAWAYMGRTFGLIMAFDKVAAAGDIAPSMLADGLKMALVGPLVGLTAFIIARILIIVLILKDRQQAGV